MKKFLSSDHGHSGDSSEPDNPPNMALFISLMALGIFMLGFGYVCHIALNYKTRMDVNAAELSQPDDKLVELRRVHDERLKNYDQVDKDKGTYQIPIDRAIELVVQNPTLIEGKK